MRRDTPPAGAPAATPAALSARRSGVNGALTVHRLRPVVENDEFARFARRVVTAHSRRVSTGDIEGLRDLDALGRAWDAAMRRAIGGLRDAGYSWADIARQLDVTRQGAHQRWGGDR